MCRSYTEQLVVLAVHLSYPICLYSMSIVYRSLLIIVNVLSLYNMKIFIVLLISIIVFRMNQ
jgi:hypothetical protein